MTTLETDLDATLRAMSEPLRAAIDDVCPGVEVSIVLTGDRFPGGVRVILPAGKTHADVWFAMARAIERGSVS